jgi:hypothetical protein
MMTEVASPPFSTQSQGEGGGFSNDFGTIPEIQ